MTNERLSFALERLKADDWSTFERFASQYLAPDYGQIRSVGSPSGDLGRDAELFSPEDKSMGSDTIEFMLS
jgi:hypothetical protein